MNVSTVNLAAILKKHMVESRPRLSQIIIGERTNLSPFTIMKFLKGKTEPHAETREKIEGYLKDQGVLTRFGFPTEMPSVEIRPEVEITPEDNEQLRSMGIRPHLDHAKLNMNEHDKRFLIYAIYHAHGSQEDKDRLLDSILAFTE